MSIPILFTIPNFITAGSGRALLNIARRLDRARFSPSICVAKSGGDLERMVHDAGIPLIEAPFTVPARPYATLPLRAWRAARVLQPWGFRLWHSFHYLDDYSEPMIARMAGARAWIYTKKNMSWNRRSWRLRSLFATRIAVQNTDMMQGFFGGRRWRDKVKLIARGVDTLRFHPDTPPRLALRERLAIGPASVIASCVAHLVPVKGHPTLLEAAAGISGLHLLIAGRPLDRTYTESLVKMAAELGIAERTHFLDDVADVPGLLAETDIFVLPTWPRWRQEGCPVALIEAMAAGRACVASDVPGSRDLVEDGRCGYLVRAEDADALARALSRLVDDADLRRRMGLAARIRAEGQFSIEREVAEHEALYNDLITSWQPSLGARFRRTP